MSKYIDAEKLRQDVLALSTHVLNEWDTLGVLDVIAKQTAADVAPVVHAKWDMSDSDNDWHIGRWKCSNCRKSTEDGTGYCPNCGAKMDEEELK